MAQSIIEVNTTTLKADISKVEEEIRAIRADRDQLREILAELSGMWDGQAKEAFAAAVNDDLARLEELVQAMEKFTNLTDESRTEYEKCENAVIGIVNAIRV